MALKTYRKWALDLAPPWLRGNWGEKLVQAFAIVFDSIVEANFEAGAAGTLDAPTFPHEALEYIGHERLVERYPAESDATYKARVKGAWESWQQAGTRHLVRELAAAGFTATIKLTYDWNWDSAVGEGGGPWWSRFWTVITVHSWAPVYWGASRRWGEGVWGCDASQPEAETLLRIIRKWKPAHMFPITVVVLDLTRWNAQQPNGTWDNAALRANHYDPGNGHLQPIAIYHYER